MHLRAILPALGLISALAVPAVAKDLKFLDNYDADALVLFECGELASEARSTNLKSGFDTYSEMAAKYRAAGKAAVIKSALLIDDDGARPVSERPSFHSKSVERKVASDIAAHAAVAKTSVAERMDADGLSGFGKCATVERIRHADALSAWLANDVGVLENIK